MMAVDYKEENNIATITFDALDSKVNVLNAAVLEEFLGIVVQLSPSVRAVVIQSAKRDIFIAGADIKDIENITDPSDGKAKSQAGQRIFDKLEDLPIPTVAVIDGAALGGGCELALACRYRVATFNPKVRIGLPEVNLGIVPGFGGTWRLPRLVGLQAALKMILSGAPVDGPTALKMGLVDRLYSQVGLSQRVREFVEGVIASPASCPAQRRGSGGNDMSNPIVHWFIFHQFKKSVLKATKGFYPAPWRALEVVRRSGRACSASTWLKSRRQALELECTAFAELAVTTISKNLVKVFYLSEKYKKLTIGDSCATVPNKVTILGAGIMGGGIAQLLSHRGVWVRLKDINYEAIAKGLKAAQGVYLQSVKRRRMKPFEVAARMAMISTTVDYSGFADADMAIEAVVEDMAIKKKVLAEVSQHVPAETILATNTSSLSVTEMGKVVKDPSKMIGFHFFNPVHRMPLVEIIITPQTSQETLAAGVEFAKRLGKTPVIVKDAPGFLVNRILLAYINEAGRLLCEGGTIAGIDKIATDFGMPMGPFTLSDEVGLDVGIKVLHVLQAGLGVRFKPAEVFDKISRVTPPLLGKKSGRGFYIYEGKRRRVNPDVRVGPRAHPNTDALTRMTHIMINEAARLLEESIVDGPDTVDIGMIMGTGFPPFRGGLLRYADALGIEAVVADLQQLEDRFQDGRFKPAGYLLDLKAKGRGFFDQ